MSKEKQIEEMAWELENHTCMSQFQAEIASKILYTLGYRKQSDVVNEIFEELNKLKYHRWDDYSGDYYIDYNDVIKLRKKYEEKKK